ncbi:MAG: hypothetical protein KC910_32220, partial [Candidatus Eremiobacteraeota bacterium]|nr:hypothetical protein [Candidatus Eremiobacteraeota bacterium]
MAGRPTPATAKGQPPAAAADTYAAAELFERQSNDEFTHITKLSIDDPERTLHLVSADGQPQMAFTSQDRRRLVVLDAAGKVKIDFAPDERVGEFCYSSQQQRFFVKTGTHLFSLDAASGQVQGQLDFEGTNYSRVFWTDREGRPALIDGQTLHRLDANLGQVSQTQLPFKVAKRFAFPGGTTLLYSDGYPEKLALLQAGDQAKELSDDAVERTITQSKDGDIWFVEGRIRGGQRLEVVRYTPATGQFHRFKSSSDASTILPLLDGRVVVYDDETTKPGLMIYDRDGHLEKRLALGHENFLRQFYLNHDQKKCYAVTDIYSDDHGPTRRLLLRADLEPEGGLSGWLSHAGAGLGLKDKAEVVYETSNEPFVPAPLDDGRILIFRKAGIDLLSPEGKVEQTFSDRAELLKAIPEPRVAAEGITLDFTAKSTVAGDFPHFYDSAAAQFDYSQRETSVGLEGWSVDPRDSTLNHRTAVPTEKALAAMGLGGLEDYQKLLKSQAIFNTLLRNQVVPFPDSPGARIEVGTRELRAWFPADGQMQTRQFSLPGEAIYTCAIPCLVDGKPHLVAASSDSMLRCYDLSKGGRPREFATKGRVVGL